MGLVNLKKINLLLFSVESDKLKSLSELCTSSGYRSLKTVSSVPEVIVELKVSKTDILVYYADLGGVDTFEFVKAIKKAFPKVKILPIADQSTLPQFVTLGISKVLKIPLSSKELNLTLDEIAMQKMGISSSTFVTD